MQTNPSELPYLTDDALVEVVQTEHVSIGRKALRELVNRHDSATAADMLDCPIHRVEELV